jgi:hypothetical protein
MVSDSIFEWCKEDLEHSASLSLSLSLSLSFLLEGSTCDQRIMAERNIVVISPHRIFRAKAVIYRERCWGDVLVVVGIDLRNIEVHNSVSLFFIQEELCHVTFYSI